MKQWMYWNSRADLKRIAQRYQISEAMAEVLVKRGLYDWESMDQYLFPKLEKMAAPELMKDLTLAADILYKKIKEGKKMQIIGDYDVDGIMSTTILYMGLQELGADISWRIPHRKKDGYGIRAYMAEEAYEKGMDTIVTCDNGISAMEAVTRAKELGMTVVLTDHHQVPENCDTGEEQIPPADAVVNPHQKNCKYPFKELCGAGVALRLMEYMLKRDKNDPLMLQLITFAAIATVCDVVPLQGENRILVKNGLDFMEKTTNIGLNELIRLQEFKRAIRSSDLGFRIGPCFNASGRLEEAGLGVELLLEQDREKAVNKASYLLELNEERKEITAEAVDAAVKKIEDNNAQKDDVLLVCVENCPESVAGIVAGRIREKYYRPTMILSVSGDKLKGSGRSIPGYHMQQELNKCSSLLLEYGGHALAAGFSLKKENLEPLRQKLLENSTLQEEDFVEKISLDAVLPLQNANLKLAKELELLQPTGQSNSAAVFAEKKVEIKSVRIFGKENQIGRFQVATQEGIFSVIDFDVRLHMKKMIEEEYSVSMWEEIFAGRGTGCFMDLLFSVEINAKYGDVQLKIIDCRRTEAER